MATEASRAGESDPCWRCGGDGGVRPARFPVAHYCLLVSGSRFRFVVLLLGFGFNPRSCFGVIDGWSRGRSSFVVERGGVKEGN